LEKKEKERQYWDPLKMMEKDRELLEKRQIKNAGFADDDSSIGSISIP